MPNTENISSIILPRMPGARDIMIDDTEISPAALVTENDLRAGNLAHRTGNVLAVCTARCLSADYFSLTQG